jgi:hypothetical protein
MAAEILTMPIRLKFCETASGQAAAGDADADPHLAGMPERCADAFAGGDEVGAVGAVYIAAVAEPRRRHGAEFVRFARLFARLLFGLSHWSPLPREMKALNTSRICADEK